MPTVTAPCCNCARRKKAWAAATKPWRAPPCCRGSIIFSTADYAPIIPSQVVPDRIFGGSGDKFTRVQFGLPFNVTAGAELSLPLVNFQQWESVRRAALQRESLQWSTAAEREGLHQQLTSMYTQYLLLGALLHLNAGETAVMDTAARLLQMRKEEGVTEPSDFYRARSLLLALQQQRAEYEKLLEQQVNALRAALCLPQSTGVEIRDSLATDAEVPVTGQWASRPLYRQALAAKRVAEQSVVEARKAAYPRLSFTGRYYYQWGMQTGAHSQTLRFDAATLGLRLDLPLFAGGSFAISRSKSLLQLEAARLQEEQARTHLEKEEADWLALLLAARKKNGWLDERLSLAAENLRIALLALKEGVQEYESFSAVFHEYAQVAAERAQNRAEVLLYAQLLQKQY